MAPAPRSGPTVNPVTREQRPEAPATAARGSEPGEAGITRQGLQLVIRRAAELAAQEADSDERLSEAEVVRIAEELGLPGRYVRRALYELPRTLDEEASLLTRWYGDSAVTATRVVPGAPAPLLSRLEDYLVTREFLQVLRKQGGRISFRPADDAISNVARAVRRPQRQWQVARSRQVLVEVRPMPDGESHARIEIDLAEQRRAAATTGGIVGGISGAVFAGAPLAAGTFFALGGVAEGIAGGAAAVAVLIGTGGGVAAGLAIARASFRARVDNARLELASLLDRLESGERLDPPPAPWLRGLRSRIAETLRNV